MRIKMYEEDRRRGQKTRKNTTALRGCLYERITTGTRPESNRSGFRLKSPGHDGFNILKCVDWRVCAAVSQLSRDVKPNLLVLDLEGLSKRPY